MSQREREREIKETAYDTQVRLARKTEMIQISSNCATTISSVGYMLGDLR